MLSMSITFDDLTPHAQKEFIKIFGDDQNDVDGTNVLAIIDRVELDDDDDNRANMEYE